MNWNSIVLCVCVAATGIVALIVGQTDAALACIGGLVGILSPPPYKQ